MSETAGEPPKAETPSDLERIRQLAYDEALRGIDGQRAALTEIRARAGLLISAATISTSFLGSAAATGHGGFPIRFLWAVVPFAISLSIAISILIPWRGWRFLLNVDAFEAIERKTYVHAIKRLTVIKGKSTRDNQSRLDVLSYLFLVSSVALLWSIIAWIVVIE